MLGPASALFLFPNWLLVARLARGLMHSLGNRSSRMRKQEPDIYPLHCRKPLMPQGLLPAHRNSQSLQVLRPAARCSSLPTPAQALVSITGRKGTEGKMPLVAPQGSAPCFRPTSVKASTQRSMSSSLCTAEIWTRMRAFPLGTTG